MTSKEIKSRITLSYKKFSSVTQGLLANLHFSEGDDVVQDINKRPQTTITS